ncbi:uncharacterized protein LOC144113447 [Amblyomma americanum]
MLTSTAGTVPSERAGGLGWNPARKEVPSRSMGCLLANCSISSASPEVQGSGCTHSGSRPPSRLLRRGKMAASHTPCRAPRREQSLDRLRNDNVQLRGQLGADRR